jgi:hypothetical protein
VYALLVATTSAYGNGAFTHLRHVDGPDALALFAPYNRFLFVISIGLALYVGIWAGTVGLHTANISLGLSALAGGVVVTALAFSAMPLDSLPGVGYPPWEVWLLGRCYIYIGAWLITAVGGLETCVSEEASPWGF